MSQRSTPEDPTLLLCVFENRCDAETTVFKNMGLTLTIPVVRQRHLRSGDASGEAPKHFRGRCIPRVGGLLLLHCVGCPCCRGKHLSENATGKEVSTVSLLTTITMQ